MCRPLAGGRKGCGLKSISGDLGGLVGGEGAVVVGVGLRWGSLLFLTASSQRFEATHS